MVVGEVRRKYSPEFRREAVQLAISSTASVAATARQLGIHEGTLANWVNAYRRNNPAAEEPLTVSERARLRELERENRDLRMKTEFLSKAAAFFAREHQ